MSLTSKLSAFRLHTLLLCLSMGVVGCADEGLLGDVFLSDKPQTLLNSSIQKDLTLTTALSPYFIEGHVEVKAGNTLTIEPGVEIRGLDPFSALIVEQGARIEAIGTANNPIVFTSSQPVGSRRAGDWSGVFINGSAKINTDPGVKQGEFNTGFYGGGNDNDNSGTLRYVRIEFAGSIVDEDTEHNSLSLYGVGRSTSIDHIHVHKSGDDCFQFYGGAVDARYLLCTDTSDDAFDFTEGWRGRGQFLIGRLKQDGAALNRGSNGIDGINANGSTTDFDVSPRSRPTLYNVTLVGDQASNNGVNLDRGAGLLLYNSIITNFEADGVYIENEKSCPHTGLRSILLHANAEFNGACDITQLMYSKLSTNVRPVADPYEISAPDFRSTGQAIDGTITPEIPTDPFFVQTNFVGGQGPTPDSDGWNWTDGWLSFPEN